MPGLLGSPVGGISVVQSAISLWGPQGSGFSMSLPAVGLFVLAVVIVALGRPFMSVLLAYLVRGRTTTFSASSTVSTADRIEVAAHLSPTKRLQVPDPVGENEPISGA